jgi:hypothetical protein
MLFLYYRQLGHGIELGQCVNKMPVVIMIILLDQQKSEKRVYFKDVEGRFNMDGNQIINKPARPTQY